MKKLLTFFVLLAVSIGMANAQVGQRTYTALQTAAGNTFAQIIPNAKIYVCPYNVNLTCSSPQNIYSDSALTHLITQPLTASPQGLYQYFVQADTYVVEKVCAPYNQCSYTGIYITGGGSGTGIQLQLNGTPLVDQSLLNFNNTTPAAPSGSSQVLFQSDSGGDLSAYTSINFSGGFTPYITPPVGGQYVFVPATSYTINQNNGTVSMSNTSGTLTLPVGTSFLLEDSVTWSGFTLPSYIVPANVTAVYAVAISSQANYFFPNFGSPGSPMSYALNCSTVNLAGTGIATNGWTTQQVSGLTTLTGTTISSATCNASIYANFSGGGNMIIPQIGFLVYYTGTAPPTSGNVLVSQPLTFNADTNSLGIFLPNDIVADTGAANAYAVSLPTYNFTPGLSIKMLVSHNSTSTTPTLTFNGSYAFTIEGPSGAALASGDMKTSVPSLLLWNGSNWLLQNPQISGGGITTNALTGAASGGASPGTTFNGSAPVTFDYHTLGAAGISGTPTIGHCTDWASTTTLGDAGAACGSGSGGSPGTPAGTVQVYKNSTTFGGTGTWIFAAGINGAVCDDATDDTAAFVALLATVNTAGGGKIQVEGKCLMNSAQIALPNSGGSSATQSSIRITGLENSGDATASPSFIGPSTLDLRFNATNGKITTLGLGRLEIDHLTLMDGGSDCAPFIYDTATIAMLHDNAFVGTASGTSACNDAIILGGTTTTQNTNNTAAGWLGYGSYVDHNHFDKIRRGVWLRVYAQAVQVTNNTWAATCGSNVNTAAAVEVGYNGGSGEVGTSDGNYFSGNYYEVTNYQYVIWVHSKNNLFIGETFWDASATLFVFHFTDSDALNTAYVSTDASITPTNLTDAQAPGTSNSVLSTTWQASLGSAAIRNRVCSFVSGSGTAQICSTGTALQYTPANGSITLFSTSTPNTGTGFTVNVNSLGAKSVAKYAGGVETTTLAAGDIVSGLNPMWYDGTNWVLYTPGTGGNGFANPMTTLGDVIYGGASGAATRLAGPTTTAHQYLLGDVPVGSAAVAPSWFDLGPGLGTYVTGTSPIVVTQNSNSISVSCPTCGTSSSTAVNMNGGSTLGTLQITGNTTQACSDSSGSGTAQTCNTATSFTPWTNSCVIYTTTTTNSGAGLTVNVNSLGAKSIAIPGSSGWTTTLTASILPANKPLPMCYDGTNWDVTQTGTVSSGSTGAWTNITGTVTVAGCTVSSGACSISGSSTTVVTFSSIPSTYNRLELVVWGQGSATLNVNTTFNSDTGSNYAVNGYVQTSSGNPTSNAASSQANCAGSGLTTGIVSQIIMDLPFYANTSFGKMLTNRVGETGSISSLGSNFNIGTTCAWNSTAAINTIAFTASTGHYVAGTEFMILAQN